MSLTVFFFLIKIDHRGEKEREREIFLPSCIITFAKLNTWKESEKLSTVKITTASLKQMQQCAHQLGNGEKINIERLVSAAILSHLSLLSLLYSFRTQMV